MVKAGSAISFGIMPSVETRLATVEAELRATITRVNEIHADIHSGPGVEWPQSIRGRLHELANLATSAANLERAAVEIRRARTQHFATWAQVVLVLCGVITAVAAIVGAVAAVP
jgi:hypothetical protein